AIEQGVIRIWHPSHESAAKLAEEFRNRLQLAVGEPAETHTPVNFGDVALEALAFPTQTGDLARAEDKLQAHARHFFEDVWARRPLRSLGGAAPLDAVGSTLMRKRVFGAVKFVEDCFTAVVPHKRVGKDVIPIEVYKFDDLRHKLGLEY